MSILDLSKARFSQPDPWPSFDALYEEANQLFPEQGEDFWDFIEYESHYTGVSTDEGVKNGRI